MKEFNLFDLLIGTLPSVTPLSSAQITNNFQIVSDLKSTCQEIGFRRAANKISLSLTRLNPDAYRLASAAAANELRNVSEAIILDATECKFVQVAQDRAEYFEAQDAFGKEVSRAFPSATEDILAAGNCMAVECNTAAVFHLMRAVEGALRALCSNLGIRSLRKKTKSGGVTVYVPVEYSQWEQILNGLQGKVDEKLSKLKRGAAKQRQQEMYYPALQELRAFRDAWRNHVMHCRRQYTRADAKALWDHVARFMKGLAVDLEEV